mgnify:CR=1 FL=1
MRKAIQTWVAIVLAIIIAIAIAVPIYLWVATLTAPKETKVGKGNMVIEDISWSYDHEVTLVIKNTGSISLLITDIYVKQGAVTLVHFAWDGSKWTSSSDDYTLKDSDGNPLIGGSTQLTIGVGESLTIIIEFNNGWDSGYTYTFKIVSSSGAIAERTEIAP